LFSDFNTDWITAKSFKFPNAKFNPNPFSYFPVVTGDDWCGGDTTTGVGGHDHIAASFVFNAPETGF
jgi:hypothetical protein